jgi:predicted nuclease of predicted toxin-antitoxin system
MPHKCVFGGRKHRPKVARWLKEHNHDVFSVYEEARGLSDDEVIQKAFSENWILITNDKDFGEKVHRERRPRRGVVLLRLADERSIVKIKILQKFLENYSDRMADNFIVVTERKVRFAFR